MLNSTLPLRWPTGALTSFVTRLRFGLLLLKALLYLFSTEDVVKSDSAVSSELKRALQEAVEKSQATIPESSRDWHPGSNKKVLDLVHPSLYPLVYGHTRILSNGGTTLEDCIERCGEGEIIKIFSKKFSANDEPAFSKKFQWLPCEVDISGDRAKQVDLEDGTKRFR